MAFDDILDYDSDMDALMIADVPGPEASPPEDFADGIQNLSMDANGTYAKPAPPYAIATPEAAPPTAAVEQRSEANESVRKSSEELVRKMEEHLARFHDNPEVQAEFEANVYSRDFLYGLRNIARELKLEKPAMPHSLEEETKDDVYIEYTAHMIERVGPAFESRKTQRTQAQANLVEELMIHFMQIKDTLSNRVRFMILNLDELRQAGWKSQRFTREQVPKTIQEVHQEAKEEEIRNRLERDAYERNKHEQKREGGYGQRNKQDYGGRPSNDYRQQQPRVPDDRRSQAAAAAMSSGSRLRKDMSLKQSDYQPETLGVKSGWAKGTGGGGRSSFFGKQPQRKPDASMPAPARSGQSLRPLDEKKVAGAVRATIDEYSLDVVTTDEAFEAVNELCQRTSVQVVFKKFFAYGGEQVKQSNDNMRRYIGQIICKCLQAESLKEDAIKGFAQYCTEAVDQELSYDCPGLWKNIARIIGWSMFCHVDNVDGGRPHMDVFTQVFKAANEQSPKEFSVLVQVLQMMVEELGNHEGMSEDDVVRSFNKGFDKLRQADPAFYESDDFKEALKKAECKLAAHPNLYSLLKPY